MEDNRMLKATVYDPSVRLSLGLFLISVTISIIMYVYLLYPASNKYFALNHELVELQVSYRTLKQLNEEDGQLELYGRDITNRAEKLKQLFSSSLVVNSIDDLVRSSGLVVASENYRSPVVKGSYKRQQARLSLKGEHLQLIAFLDGLKALPFITVVSFIEVTQDDLEVLNIDLSVVAMMQAAQES